MKRKIGNKIYTITKKTNLSKVLADIIKLGDYPANMTIDNFYDKVGVKKKYRTDFGTASLLKNAQKFIKGDEK